MTVTFMRPPASPCDKPRRKTMRARWAYIAIPFLGLSLFAPRLIKASDPYAPLWLYQGGWRLAGKSNNSAETSVQLTNACALIGKYFACQQTVNGSVASLIIFIPTAEAGHYYTQAVLPEGLAAGRGQLDIEGDRWTYNSKDDEDGSKNPHHRTTNLFTGKDRIHFEQLESADGQHWTVIKSGDEMRSDH